MSILITRPRDASERLALKLQNLGYEGVIEPLLSILPTHQPLPDLTQIDALMITSANAVAMLEKNQPDKDLLLGLPCFCVGTQTAVRAMTAGFTDIHDAAGDGIALVRLMASRLKKPHTSILHIAGTHVDSATYDALLDEGFSVVPWTIYRAEAVQEFSPLVLQRFKRHELSAVMVFSTRTAMTLKALLTHYALQPCCQHLTAIGISEVVAEVLDDLPWLNLFAAAAPTEESVLELLQKRLPVSGTP